MERQVINNHLLDINQFKHIFKNNDDINIFSKQYYSPPAYMNNSSSPFSHEVIFVLSKISVNQALLNETIYPAILNVYNSTKFQSLTQLEEIPTLFWTTISTENKPISINELAKLAFEGNLLCIFPGLKAIMSVNVCNIPKRSPEESATEPSIRGPRDGLIEDLDVNLAIIRKRIKSNHLAQQTYLIGTKSETKLSLLYMDNIANEDLIRNIKERLENIEIENLITTGQLEESLCTKNFFSFPTIDYSSRPDFIVDSLLSGRFVLILDNNPSALIAPGNLVLLLKSPEDSYFPLLSSNIGKAFRMIALITTIFLPAFFIAIATFHPDQIPFSLLATISISRMGLPMEASLEMFLIMVLMELFREASIRLPSSIGQTLTVVGGLIIGEASIRAGLVSPIIIVMSAITLVASATLVNQSLTSTVVLIRFVAFLFASILGMFGVILSFILLLLHLSTIRSFGVPYLAPIAPLNLKSILPAIFQVPMKWGKKGPNYLYNKNRNKE